MMKDHSNDDRTNHIHWRERHLGKTASLKKAMLSFLMGFKTYGIPVTMELKYNQM